MTKTKTVKDWRVSWQAEHEQYWQGHGITFTSYDRCSTGIGETLREALEDALEQLAEDDIVLDELAVLSDLASQCRGHADYEDPLDVTIVDACCEVRGEHDAVEVDDETTEDSLDVDNLDCAVCAGEWHFYANVDVRLEEEAE